MKRRCRKVGNSNQLGKNWFPPRCSFCSFPIDGSPVFSLSLVSFFVFPVFFDVKKEQKIDQICPGGYLFRNISPSPPNCVYPRSREREHLLFPDPLDKLALSPMSKFRLERFFFLLKAGIFFADSLVALACRPLLITRVAHFLSALSLHPTFPAILVPLSHFP